MDKKVEEMDESMKAMQRRIDEIQTGEGNQDFEPGGNAATQEADQDQMNPASMAGAAGGTAGSGTDPESGGELGASTGTGYHGHVGGIATENNS